METFERIYKPKLRGKNPLEKLKGVDACGIPPCEREVAAHILETNDTRFMWAATSFAWRNTTAINYLQLFKWVLSS